MTDETQTIPNLPETLTEPLINLENSFAECQSQIESWFEQQWESTPLVFYGSVDLRNAGYKVAPVDTNLFPAGFNNLSDNFLAAASDAAKKTIEQLAPGSTNVMLIPEDHTRNLKYLENVQRLQGIITNAGYTCKIGSLRDDVTEPTQIDLEHGHITLYPIERSDSQLMISGQPTDVVVLNNDLSDGVPEILKHLQHPILPSIQVGWSNRLKSKHFALYKQVVEEFSKHIGLKDPWFINPLFSNCGEINFKTRTGEDCLVRHVTQVLNQISEKYQHYQINAKPYVVVKTDSGSYGMGVMIVHDPDEIKSLNRKQRNNMSVTKGKQSVSNVIIQEGVYTFETLGNEQSFAEPVVYMIGRCVIGGFYRVHTQKGANQNLNAPGMHFEPLPFASCCNAPEQTNAAKRFYMYGVIARLALLAASRELRLMNEELT